MITDEKRHWGRERTHLIFENSVEVVIEAWGILFDCSQTSLPMLPSKNFADNFIIREITILRRGEVVGKAEP